VSSKIGIIGGGPAGLGLAYSLVERGHSVTLLEGDSKLGGLARSFLLGGSRIERYYHFLCGDDSAYLDFAGRLGIGSQIRWTATRTGFFHDGVLYPFASALDLLRCRALGPVGRLRYGALAALCAARTEWRDLDDIPAKEWLIRHLGEETYRVMWHPLLEVKFHEHHDKISAAWIWHRMHRVARSRGSGLQRERFGYLEGGTEVLVEALVEAARRRGARLITSMPVTRIRIEGGRCTGVVTASGERHDFDAVVSAVPLPLFLRMTPDLPPSYREGLEEIGFIGVVCVALRLREAVTPYYWLNINDARVPYNGFIEYTNLNPGMTGDGTKVVYVPFYLPRHHERFTYSDDRQIRDAIASLGVVSPRFSPDSVVDAAVSRDAYAQVICSTGFRKRVPSHQTPVPGLYLIESSQLYPSDRTISGTLDLATNVCRLLSDR
jgi:protoporphyrinogen oxidase